MVSLRRYCTDELEIELIDVQIAMLLRFVLKEIAPSAYNAGLAAAEAFLRDRLADLEGVCSEHWKSAGRSQLRGDRNGG